MRRCRKGDPKGRQTFAFCRTHLAFKGSCDSIVCVLICFFSLYSSPFCGSLSCDNAQSGAIYRSTLCALNFHEYTTLNSSKCDKHYTLLSGINSSLIMECIIEESYARSPGLHPLTLLCTGRVRLSLCSLSFISSALPNFSFFLH